MHELGTALETTVCTPKGYDTGAQWESVDSRFTDLEKCDLGSLDSRHETNFMVEIRRQTLHEPQDATLILPPPQTNHANPHTSLLRPTTRIILITRESSFGKAR